MSVPRLDAKRIFDLAGATLLLVPLGFFGLLLLILNLWFNPGRLFYVQERMGHDCRPFRVWKFRTMIDASDASAAVRGAFDRLEADRITPLGRFLRKMRIDELPQAINVLRGEMSLIGPRPDYIVHAREFLESVPGYRARHSVLPGISGLAQTEVGYVDGPTGIRRKVAADLVYIRRASFGLDLWIAWRTLRVIFLRRGA